MAGLDTGTNQATTVNVPATTTLQDAPSGGTPGNITESSNDAGMLHLGQKLDAIAESMRLQNTYLARIAEALDGDSSGDDPIDTDESPTALDA